MITNTDGTLQLRYDTIENWSEANPTLKKGEVGFSLENGRCRMKVGDGATNWQNLTYIGVDVGSVYPVGSVYFSVNDTSPATLFGGTWESLGDDLKIKSANYFWDGISVYAWKRTA